MTTIKRGGFGFKWPGLIYPGGVVGRPLDVVSCCFSLLYAISLRLACGHMNKIKKKKKKKKTDSECSKVGV